MNRILNRYMNDYLIIRPIKKSEIGFLDTMLYNAIFVPPNAEKLPDNIIEHPQISKYIKDFGREGDLCFVAEIEGELVGTGNPFFITKNNDSKH